MSGTIKYFDNHFVEASSLLVGSRDYMKYYGDDVCEKMSVPHKLLYISESTRVTSRLLIAMSWIMEQPQFRGASMFRGRRQIFALYSKSASTSLALIARIFFAFQATFVA